MNNNSSSGQNFSRNSDGNSRDNLALKKSLKKQVLYPFFQEASKLTNDPFWISKLEDASRGKFPKKFSFKDGCLMFRMKNKKIVEKFINCNDPGQCYSDFINFLATEAGISSDIDNERSVYRNELSFENPKSDNNKWNKIKKKSNEASIERFVCRQRINMNLTQEQVTNLKSVINTGFYFNMIESSDVTLYDGEIESINGIYYDGKTFYLDPVKLDKCLIHSIGKLSKTTCEKRMFWTKPNHIESDFLNYNKYYAENNKNQPIFQDRPMFCDYGQFYDRGQFQGFTIIN